MFIHVRVNETTTTYYNSDHILEIIPVSDGVCKLVINNRGVIRVEHPACVVVKAINQGKQTFCVENV